MEIYKQISHNQWLSTFLIFIVFGIIIALGYIISVIFDSLFILIIAVVVSIIYTIIGYSFSKSIVLKSTGAKLADPVKDAYIVNTVEGLSLSVGIPTPEVYIIEDPNPNAFATGKDPKNSAIAVTRGLLNIMDRQELEGVLAHEMAHIKNYDIRFMTLTAVLVGMIAIIAQITTRMFIFGGLRGNNRQGSSNMIVIVIGLLFMILAPIFATLVQLAISRKREYLADASGALMTRYPEGLASALEKLKNHDTKIKTASSATAPLFIATPIKSQITSLFSTHPPLEERIKKLRGM
ncbi:M48 family metallopeptidase [Candidatus Micrarchaeota archaeon]|jgi:heat shock protein HtpX|nr:M48 family metallopeptidase [Candidatus Micrarchaeota archaeon]